ncbi:MAG: 4Fe-4S dicluster domain-containing protein [Deltaproteobacteria bacterium]|nr:4Fe-4S dicluster domain-containing protein [Deltaproteobacteria bacterium]
MKTITISLNGKEVSGRSGTTILDLASQVGIHIPTLCHHPLLKSVGACRVCLVEDVKTGRVLASCVTPIAEGMEIRTDSAAAVAARRGVLELILSDHPSACVVCSKGNDCVLRDLAKDHGMCDPELDPLRRWRPTQEVNPFITRDLSKCVMCGRCIRVCTDFEAVGAVDYMDRGFDSHPDTAYGPALDGSECTFCGSCVALCPTDALAERDRLTTSSGKDLVAGVCSYCGTGCHAQYELADGEVVGARGHQEAPLNSISLCVRGRYGQDALSSPRRLTSPMIRQGDGALNKASWEDALNQLAARLQEIKKRHGAESIGVIAGQQCSNEDLYLAVRFARSVLCTPNMDTTSKFSSRPVSEGIAAALRTTVAGAALEGVSEAETILLVGARPDYTHPVIARNVRQAVRNRGAALIQLDALRTTLSDFATLHFREDVEQQTWTLFQIMRELVATRHHDEEFLTNNVMASEDFISSLMGHPRAQLPGPEVKQAAQLLAKGRKTVFLLGPLLARASHGYMMTRLVADLAFLCGRPENLFFLYEGCNELGTLELGCGPNGLPGCGSAQDPAVLENLRSVWGGDVTADRGMDAMGMIRGAEKRTIKALLFIGVDPLTVLPDTERTQKALEAVDLVVRTGMFPAPDREVAHMIFPAAAPTETDGTYINLEGRVQRVSKLCNPPGEARPHARFLLDLSGTLGNPLGFVTARQIFEEIWSLSPALTPVSWVDAARPGGVRIKHGDLSSGAEAAGNEKGKFVPYPPPATFPSTPRPPRDRPWKVYPEEQTAHPGDGVLSGMSRRLAKFANGESVRMHPDDAEAVQAADGRWVSLVSEVGEARAVLRIDSDVPRGGIVAPVGGPSHLLQRLLPWPEEYCPLDWDRLFVSVTPVED